MPEKALRNTAQTGGHHQHADDENRREQLLLLADDDLGDDVEGIVVGVDTEQTEDPYDAEQTEHRGAGGEENGQIVGQKREQINDPVKGEHIAPQRVQLVKVRIEIVGRKEAQNIIHGKEEHRDSLHPGEQRTVDCADIVKGHGKGRDQIDKQRQGADDIIALVDRVVHNADRDHPEDPLAQERDALFARFLHVTAAFLFSHHSRKSERIASAVSSGAASLDTV